MSAGDVLIRPVVSEESMKQFGQGKYTFLVHPEANKVQIAQAVEETFKVKVAAVNTVTRKGRAKRGGPGGIGRTTRTGRTGDSKKAIITLKPGYKIESYQGIFG